MALANDSDFGLGGSVFDEDVAHGKLVANRVETGMVFVNHPTWTSPADLPFGESRIRATGASFPVWEFEEFVKQEAGSCYFDRCGGISIAFV